MIKIFFIILYFIVSTKFVFAEIWDFGLGILVVPVRAGNYDTVPTQIEIGVSSVKGYGLSVTKQSTKSFENLTKEEIIGDNTYTYRFGLSSDALLIFYRFENYEDRWDLGLMHNRNIYTANIEKKGDSEEVGKTTFNVSYTGPYIQYSSTLTGYETDDWYYGIRLFSISLSKSDSTPYNFIMSDDTYLRDYNNEINNFMHDNNPKTAAGINLTFGFRL